MEACGRNKIANVEPIETVITARKGLQIPAKILKQNLVLKVLKIKIWKEYISIHFKHCNIYAGLTVADGKC
jgi:hypothetical protein